MRIAVVGLGLIGGSIALAARQRVGATLSGYDASPQALKAAIERLALDRACERLGDAVADAEAVFVAVPVGELEDAVSEALRLAPAECVISDVGSTKRSIVAALNDPRFVGGHPLAGAETSGIEHARGDLFAGATWYLTPTASTSGILYERLYRLLRAVGARPAAIDAQTHDAILATVSHLPHVLANVLVGQAAAELEAGDERLPATGPSFRDATRVAGASSAIWTDIYLANRDALAGAIGETVQRLEGVREALLAADLGRITAWN
ncbi:MAG TPA: prephenate dehydrogenase/arogenate dehydrogenase family protein, partial [Solirubrobacteraceae bacterium]